LLLTPTIDHLFDKGCISFEDKGDLIVSPVADRSTSRPDRARSTSRAFAARCAR